MKSCVSRWNYESQMSCALCGHGSPATISANVAGAMIEILSSHAAKRVGSKGEVIKDLSDTRASICKHEVLLVIKIELGLRHN